MPDEKDILWESYKQSIEQGLHHQKQRTATTNIILGIAGGILALVNYDHKIDVSDVRYSWALVGLGAFGAALSWKYRERYAFYLRRAVAYRAELEKRLPGLGLEAIEKQADDETGKEYKFIYKRRVANFWVSLNILILIAGVILLYLARGT